MEEKLNEIIINFGYIKEEDTWIKKYQVQEPQQVFIINGQRSQSNPKLHNIELKIIDLGYILSKDASYEGDDWPGTKYKQLRFVQLIDDQKQSEFEIAAEISDINFFAKHIESFSN